MTKDLQTRWYVVETHAHAELKASSHLRRQGFDTYLPCFRKRRHHARRVETVTVPLFPRYLFVAADLAAQRWRAIQSTCGVVRLITDGEKPIPLGDDVIDSLKNREDTNGFVCLSTQRQMKPGDKIHVLDGAFEACIGFLECVTANERVAILLDVLGRKVRIMLDAASIAAA